MYARIPTTRAMALSFGPFRIYGLSIAARADLYETHSYSVLYLILAFVNG